MLISSAGPGITDVANSSEIFVGVYDNSAGFRGAPKLTFLPVFSNVPLVLRDLHERFVVG